MRCLSSIVFAGSLVAASAAFAQGPGAASPGGANPGGVRPGGMKPKAASPGGTSAKAPPSRSWAKLCETPPAGSSDLLGQPGEAGVKTCLIHHEQLDSTSGALRVAAGVRQAEGRQTFLVKVPVGVDRDPGVRLMILPRDLWLRVQRNEQVPLAQSTRVRKLNLGYSLCNAEGCIAETKATPGLLAELKSSGGLLIVILKATQAFAYSVPLDGFREAYDGPPVDTAKFYAARAELLRQLRERQKQGLQPPLLPGGPQAVPPGIPGGGQGVVPPRLPGDGQGPPGGPPGDKLIPPPRPGGGQDI
jgi:invasion protein IalB